jgi:uncharacterized protein involved in exopolysaccharide biosynthesis
MNDQNLAPQYVQHHDDEIDLKKLFFALWKGKWIILFTSFVFAVGGVLHALSLPNIYKAEAILAYANDRKTGGLAGLASQFGGLASFAGVNLGSGSTDSKVMALATLQSRQFMNAFINKYDLLPQLMAGEKWDSSQNKLIINSNSYDISEGEWATNDAGASLKPSDWSAYSAFKSVLTVSENKSTGLITLSITHLSPTIAKQWVDWLVIELNSWMKDKSLDETRRNIRYLEGQIEKTNITDMQSVFYQLIEEQTKNLMLAEVQDEFVFKIIDPAVVPEEKVGPRRARICVLAVLLGGMLGTAIVLIRYAFTKKD